MIDRNTVSNGETEELLPLFRDSTIETDYMTAGEVKDLDMLQTLLQSRNLIHFIAYEDNIPVACCQVIHKAQSTNFHTGAKINALSVMPHKRGMGVGTELMNKVVEALREKPEIRNIYLDVVKENTAAVKLYEKLGFKKVGELKNAFIKDGTLMDIETFSLLV